MALLSTTCHHTSPRSGYGVGGGGGGGGSGGGGIMSLMKMTLCSWTLLFFFAIFSLFVAFTPQVSAQTYCTLASSFKGTIASGSPNFYGPMWAGSTVTWRETSGCIPMFTVYTANAPNGLSEHLQDQPYFNNPQPDWEIVLEDFYGGWRVRSLLDVSQVDTNAQVMQNLRLRRVPHPDTGVYTYQPFYRKTVKLSVRPGGATFMAWNAVVPAIDFGPVGFDRIHCIETNTGYNEVDVFQALQHPPSVALDHPTYDWNATISAQPGDLLVFPAGYKVDSNLVLINDTSTQTVVLKMNPMISYVPLSTVVNTIKALRVVPPVTLTSQNYNHTIRYNLMSTTYVSSGYPGVGSRGSFLLQFGGPFWGPAYPQYEDLRITKAQNHPGAVVSDHLGRYWFPLSAFKPGNYTPYQILGAWDEELVWENYTHVHLNSILPTGTTSYSVFLEGICHNYVSNKTRKIVVEPTPFPALVANTANRRECAVDTIAPYHIFTNITIPAQFSAHYRTRDVKFVLRATYEYFSSIQHYNPGDIFVIPTQFVVAGQYPELTLSVNLTAHPNGLTIAELTGALNNITLAPAQKAWVPRMRYYTLHSLTPLAGQGGVDVVGNALQQVLQIDAPNGPNGYGPIRRPGISFEGVVIPAADVPQFVGDEPYSMILDLDLYFESRAIVHNITISAKNGTSLDGIATYDFPTKRLQIFWHFPNTNKLEILFTMRPTDPCDQVTALYTIRLSYPNVHIDPNSISADRIYTCANYAATPQNARVPTRLFPNFQLLNVAPTDLLHDIMVYVQVSMEQYMEGDEFVLPYQYYVASNGDQQPFFADPTKMAHTLHFWPHDGATWDVETFVSIVRGIEYVPVTNGPAVERELFVTVRRRFDTDAPQAPLNKFLEFYTAAHLPTRLLDYTLPTWYILPNPGVMPTTDPLPFDLIWSNHHRIRAITPINPATESTNWDVSFDLKTRVLQWGNLGVGNHTIRLRAEDHCGFYTSVDMAVVRYRESYPLTPSAVHRNYCPAFHGGAMQPFTNLTFADPNVGPRAYIYYSNFTLTSISHPSDAYHITFPDRKPAYKTHVDESGAVVMSMSSTSWRGFQVLEMLGNITFTPTHSAAGDTHVLELATVTQGAVAPGPKTQVTLTPIHPPHAVETTLRLHNHERTTHLPFVLAEHYTNAERITNLTFAAEDGSVIVDEEGEIGYNATTNILTITHDFRTSQQWRVKFIVTTQDCGQIAQTFTLAAARKPIHFSREAFSEVLLTCSAIHGAPLAKTYLFPMVIPTNYQPSSVLYGMALRVDVEHVLPDVIVGLDPTTAQVTTTRSIDAGSHQLTMIIAPPPGGAWTMEELTEVMQSIYITPPNGERIFRVVSLRSVDDSGAEGPFYLTQVGPVDQSELPYENPFAPLLGRVVIQPNLQGNFSIGPINISEMFFNSDKIVRWEVRHADTGEVFPGAVYNKDSNTLIIYPGQPAGDYPLELTAIDMCSLGHKFEQIVTITRQNYAVISEDSITSPIDYCWSPTVQISPFAQLTFTHTNLSQAIPHTTFLLHTNAPVPEFHFPTPLPTGVTITPQSAPSVYLITGGEHFTLQQAQDVLRGLKFSTPDKSTDEFYIDVTPETRLGYPWTGSSGSLIQLGSLPTSLPTTIPTVHVEPSSHTAPHGVSLNLFELVERPDRITSAMIGPDEDGTSQSHIATYDWPNNHLIFHWNFPHHSHTVNLTLNLFTVCGSVQFIVPARVVRQHVEYASGSSTSESSCANIQGAVYSRALLAPTYRLANVDQTDTLPGVFIVFTCSTCVEGDALGMDVMSHSDYLAHHGRDEHNQPTLTINPTADDIVWTVARAEEIIRSVYIDPIKQPQQHRFFIALSVGVHRYGTEYSPNLAGFSVGLLAPHELPFAFEGLTRSIIEISAEQNNGTFTDDNFDPSEWFAQPQHLTNWRVVTTSSEALPGLSIDQMTHVITFPTLSPGQHTFHIVATTRCGSDVFIEQKVMVYRKVLARINPTTLRDTAYCFDGTPIPRGWLFGHVAFITSPDLTPTTVLDGVSFVATVLPLEDGQQDYGDLIMPTTAPDVSFSQNGTTYFIEPRDGAAFTTQRALNILRGISFSAAQSRLTTQYVSLAVITRHAQINPPAVTVAVHLDFPIKSLKNTITLPPGAHPATSTSPPLEMVMSYGDFWERPDEIVFVDLTPRIGEFLDDKVLFNSTSKQLTIFWHFPDPQSVELPLPWTLMPPSSCPPQEHIITLIAQRDHIAIDPAVHREEVGTCAAIPDATEKKSVIFPTFTIVGKSPDDLLPGSALSLNLGSAVVPGDVYQIESEIGGDDYEMKMVGSEITITPKPITSSWTVSRIEDIARNITYSTTTAIPTTTTPRTVSIRVTTYGSDTTTPAPASLSTSIAFLTNNDLPNVIPGVTPTEIVISAAQNDAGSFVSSALPLSTYFRNAQYVTKWSVNTTDGSSFIGASIDIATQKMSLPTLTPGVHTLRIVATTTCGNEIFVEQQIFAYRTNIAQLAFSSSATNPEYCHTAQSTQHLAFPDVVFANTELLPTTVLAGTSFVVEAHDGDVILADGVDYTVDATTTTTTTHKFIITPNDNSPFTMQRAIEVLKLVKYTPTNTTTMEHVVSVQSVTTFAETPANPISISLHIAFPIKAKDNGVAALVGIPPAQNDGTFITTLVLTELFSKTPKSISLADVSTNDFTITTAGVLSVLKPLPDDGSTTNLVVDVVDDCGNAAQTVLPLKVQVIATQLKDVTTNVEDLCHLPSPTATPSHVIFPTFSVDLDNVNAILRDVTFIITLSSPSAADVISFATSYDVTASGLAGAYDAATGKFTIHTATSGVGIAKSQFEIAVKALRYSTATSSSSSTTTIFNTKTFTITTSTPDSVDEPNTLSTTLHFLHPQNLPKRTAQQFSPILLSAHTATTSGAVITHDAALSTYWSDVDNIKSMGITDVVTNDVADDLVTWSATTQQLNITTPFPRGVRKAFDFIAVDKCDQQTVAQFEIVVQEPTIVFNNVPTAPIDDQCLLTGDEHFLIAHGVELDFTSGVTLSSQTVYNTTMLVTLNAASGTDVLSWETTTNPNNNNLHTSYDSTTGVFTIAPLNRSVAVDVAHYEEILQALRYTTTSPAVLDEEAEQQFTRQFTLATISPLSFAPTSVVVVNFAFLTPSQLPKPLPAPAGMDWVAVEVPFEHNTGNFTMQLDLEQYWSFTNRVATVELSNIDGTAATNITWVAETEMLSVVGVLEIDLAQHFHIITTDVCGQETRRIVRVTLLAARGNNSAVGQASLISTILAIVVAVVALVWF